MGRHREFDVEQALDAALFVFWEKGYEGASFEDLSSATGVARPGLYRVFGNKEALFRKVLDRYEAEYLSFAAAAMERPTSYEAVEQILLGSAKVQTINAKHPGCLETNSSLASSPENEGVRQELVRRRGLAESALCRRLERSRSDGDLPRSADCAALAAYVMTIMHGMAVQAKSGATRQMLVSIVAQALQVWRTLSSKDIMRH